MDRATLLQKGGPPTATVDVGDGSTVLVRGLTFGESIEKESLFTGDEETQTLGTVSPVVLWVLER